MRWQKVRINAENIPFCNFDEGIHTLMGSYIYLNLLYLMSAMHNQIALNQDAFCA